MATPIEIVPFTPDLREHFERLNREWLEADFVVEPVDEEMFADPQRIILEPGGHIWFARVDGEVVGTCALKRDTAGFELIKMGVTASARGMGIGKALIKEAFRIVVREGVDRVFLVTNSSLAPALHLYEAAGFRVTHRGQHPKYARGDLVMEWSP